MYLFTAISWSSGLQKPFHKRSQKERYNENFQDVTNHLLCNKSCQNIISQIDLTATSTDLTSSFSCNFQLKQDSWSTTLVRRHWIQHQWAFIWANCASLSCCVLQTFKKLLAHAFFHVCQSFNGQYSGRSVKEEKKKRGEGRNKEK